MCETKNAQSRGCNTCVVDSCGYGSSALSCLDIDSMWARQDRYAIRANT